MKCRYYFFFSCFRSEKEIQREKKEKTFSKIPLDFCYRPENECECVPSSDSKRLHAYACTKLQRYFARKRKLTSSLDVTHFIFAIEHSDMHKQGIESQTRFKILRIFVFNISLYSETFADDFG